MKNEGSRELVIIQDGENKPSSFYKCANLGCIAADPEEKIPTEYTGQQARDKGWRFTRDKRFSENGDLVGVCPTCASLYQWNRKS